MKKVRERRNSARKSAVQATLFAAIVVILMVVLSGCDEASAAAGASDGVDAGLPGGDTVTGDLGAFAVVVDGGYPNDAAYASEIVGTDGDFPLERFMTGSGTGTATTSKYLDLVFLDDTHDFALEPGTYEIIDPNITDPTPGTVADVTYAEELRANWDAGTIIAPLVASNDPDGSDLQITGGDVTVGVSNGVYSITYSLETAEETFEGSFTGLPSATWCFHLVSVENDIASGEFDLLDFEGTEDGQAITSWSTIGLDPFPVSWYVAFDYMAEPAPLVGANPSVGDSWTDVVDDGWSGTTTVVDTDYTASGYVEAGVDIEGCLLLSTEITGSGWDEDADSPATTAQNEFVRGTRTMIFAPGIGIIGVDYEHEDGSTTTVRLASHDVAASEDYFPMAAGNTWTYYWYNDNAAHGYTQANYITETWTMDW